MIQVIVKKQENRITGFHIEGHSGYAGRGSDIVCAAVSALSLNCVNSVDQFTEDAFTVESDEDRGLLDFELTSVVSEQSKLLLQSLLLGIRGIEKAYGSQYVSIINR